ncbi:MAG: response regulator [Microcoleaceae cyanobacterium]
MTSEYLGFSAQCCSQQQPSILAVDDDEDNLFLLSYVLEQLGYRVSSTTDSDEVLPFAISQQPQIILLDIILPKQDGFELLHHLRKHHKTSHITVIATTGLAFPKDRQRLLMAGFDDYISKPYLISDLETLIEQYIEPLVVANKTN